MSTLYGYKNKLWKVKETFTYTGSPELFVLNPGKYLLICNGAKGGNGLSGAALDDIARNGGTSYGVLNLTTQKSFYAVVGGDGCSPTPGGSTPPVGGYNGGGNGGAGYTTSYYNGASGGGASDIRTSLNEEYAEVHETVYLPSEYQRLDYIEFTGDQQLNFNLVDSRSVQLDMTIDSAASDNVTLGFSGRVGNFFCFNNDGKVYLDDNVHSSASYVGRHKYRFTRNSEEYKSVMTIDESETIDATTAMDLIAMADSGNYEWRNQVETAYPGDGIYGGYAWMLWPAFKPLKKFQILKCDVIPETSAGMIIDTCNNTTNGHQSCFHIMQTPGVSEYSNWGNSGTTYIMDSFCDYIRPATRPYKASTAKLYYPFTTNPIFHLFNNVEFSSLISQVTSSTYTTPEGTIIYSGEYSGRPAYGPFNGWDSQTWDGNSWAEWTNIIDGNPDKVYLGFEFNYPVTMTGLYISNVGDRAYTAAIQVKQNGSWNTVKTITIPAGNIPNSGYDSRYYNQIVDFDTPTICDGFRISIIAPTGIYFSTNQYGNNICEIFAYGHKTYSSETTPMKIHEMKNFNSNGDSSNIFVPCKKIATNEIGFYDLIENQFYTSTSSTEFIAGNEIEDTGAQTDYSTGTTITLLSRFIVAGGGGGGHIENTTTLEGYVLWAAMGGGIVGGPVMCNPSNTMDYGKYASQTDGYQFGIGQNGGKGGPGSWSAEGRGGGGGGWFGGYAIQNTNNMEHLSGSGGGGSGYVLTESSYKPIGYQCGPELYLTDTFMSAGHAESASIIICEEANVIQAGDTIVVPPTGETCSFPLPIGQYTLKCCGGMGGINQSAAWQVAGGYAQGTLTLNSPTNIFCNVGGSGIGDSLISNTYCHQFRPEMNFNGGGAPGVYGTCWSSNGKSGGGATDIRIGSNSLYARVIVAGGSGGQGNYMSGAGGGTTGGVSNGGYGENAGAGTQTETPHNTYSFQYPTTAGDFGYGGNAYNHPSNWGGGAGGGGWFGGNGTYPTRNNTKGGSGGSGYVLTESSYKPTGYLLNSSYNLSDTVLTQGGNALFFGETRIRIDVISATNVKILCRDAEGLKAYNGTEWSVIQEELTVQTFNDYGVIYIENENGLLDEYEILVYDPTESFTKVEYGVTPNKQTVTQTTRSQMTVASDHMEYEYNTDEYDVSMSFTRNPDGPNTTIVTKVELDKLDPDAITVPKVYYAQYVNKK